MTYLSYIWFKHYCRINNNILHFILNVRWNGIGQTGVEHLSIQINIELGRTNWADYFYIITKLNDNNLLTFTLFIYLIHIKNSVYNESALSVSMALVLLFVEATFALLADVASVLKYKMALPLVTNSNW